MQESCAVELRVQLPRAIAVELQEAQWRDPELLTWIICQGFAKSAGLTPEVLRDMVERAGEEVDER